MKVINGKVVDGVIVTKERLREGAEVTVIVRGDSEGSSPSRACGRRSARRCAWRASLRARAPDADPNDDVDWELAFWQFAKRLLVSC